MYVYVTLVLCSTDEFHLELLKNTQIIDKNNGENTHTHTRARENKPKTTTLNQAILQVKGQRLQVVDKFTYLGSTLSRVCTLMMKSMLELTKLVQHLAGYVEVFGTEVESDLTQS